MSMTLNIEAPTGACGQPDIIPLACTFGIEVRGCDLSTPLSVDIAGTLRTLLAEHKLLVFRSNPGVGPHELHRFSSIFGVPEEAEHPTHPNLPERPGVKLLESNVTDLPAGAPLVDTWHTDGATRASTRCVTALQAIDVPDLGRDTMFCDMEAVFEALSEPMKAFLSGKTALHSWGRQKPDAPPVEHPVVMTNPVNGRRALYLNRLYTRSIVGLRQDESDALLNLLLPLTHYPEHQLRVRWGLGDIVVWDNEMTQHYLVFDRAYPRVMHRCMMF